jgi:hypothetical protein
LVTTITVDSPSDVRRDKSHQQHGFQPGDHKARREQQRTGQQRVKSDGHSYGDRRHQPVLALLSAPQLVPARVGRGRITHAAFVVMHGKRLPRFVAINTVSTATWTSRR